MRPRGFTLVEVLVTCALVGVTAALAVPNFQAQLAKSRRADGVAALTRLQAAQDRRRTDLGAYTGDLSLLKQPARSGEGFYTLAVELAGADGYRATATAVGVQAGDHDCAQLELRVASGFAEFGPSARCWNR